MTARWWAVLRAFIVLAWVSAAAIAWWTAPREHDYDRARADVATGKVIVYQWGDRWDGNTTARWFDGGDLRSEGTQGPLFVWRTSNGRVNWTDTTDFDQITLTGPVERENYSGAGAAGLAQDLRADRLGDVSPLRPVVAAIGLALALTFLVVIVAGPAPARGTRWFWFWLVSGLPYGLGLLFWMFRDRPWPIRPPLPAPAPDAKRDRGWLGLVTGMLASLVLSVVLLGLHALLGDRWVPLPGG